MTQGFDSSLLLATRSPLWSGPTPDHVLHQISHPLQLRSMFHKLFIVVAK